MKLSGVVWVLLLSVAPGCTAIVDAGSYETFTDEDASAKERVDAAADGPDAAHGRMMDGGPDGAAGTKAPPSVAGHNSEPEDDGGPMSPTEVDLDKLEQTVLALANWMCIQASRCESRLESGTDPVQRARVLALCHPEATRRVHLMPIVAAAQAGEIAFDPDAADRCLTALKSTSQGEGQCAADLLQSGVSECEDILSGRGTVGMACSVDLQCEQGLICSGNSSQCGGSCQKPGRQGDPCADTGDCGSSFSCDAEEHFCVSKAANNLPCSTNEECESGFYCRAGASRSTCVPQAAEEEECVLGNVQSCAGELLCVQPESGTDPATCGVGVGLGGACSPERPCGLGGRCVRSGADDKCVPTARPGGSCNSDAQCPSGFFCGADGCEPQPLLDQACDEADDASPRKQCVEGVCIDGMCSLGGAAASCRFDPAVFFFNACDGFCASDGQCVANVKVAGSECEGDYECASTLICEPAADTSNPSTCQPAACE